MKRSTFDELLARGIDAHQRLAFDDALKAFRSALDLRALDAEAQSLFGLTLVRLARYEEAESWLRKAVAREPNEPGFRFNLVELLVATRQYDAAAAELETIASKTPNLARAWFKLG